MATETGTLFISPDEREIDRIDMLSTGGKVALKNDYLIVTNKRLYYKGAAMSISDGNLFGAGEAIIDLAHITGTYFSVVRKVVLLIMGIIFAIGGLYLISNGTALGWMAVIMGAISILIYFIAATKQLCIAYCGNVLRIQIKGISAGTSVENFRRFNNSVHATAEQCRAEPDK